MSKGAKLELPELAEPRSGTSQEYAYRRLRRSLMVGAIAPGRSITIRGLAEALEVSPTPVREALRRLSAEGALSVLENRRIIVPEMSAQRFEELIALRCVIEQHAAERALPYISEVFIEELAVIDRKGDAAVAAHDHEAQVLSNQEFHVRLHSVNPFQVVVPMLESLWLQLGPFQRIAAAYVEEYYYIDRHAEILKALRKRDPLALSIAIEADIRDGVGRLGRDALQKILGDGGSDRAA